MAILINTVDHGLARSVASDHGNLAENVIEMMHAVQHAEGYISEGALITLADAVNISRADIHGIVSFYHDFKRTPQARQTIKICRAEACQALGANELIAEAEKAFGVKLDKGGQEVGLEAAYCLGNCALSPAVMIGDDLYGRVDLAKLKAVSAKHLKAQNSGAMA